MTFKKLLLEEKYPNDSKALTFCPSFRWAQRWAELQNMSVEERLPKIRKFPRRYRKLMQEPARRRRTVFSEAEAGLPAVQARDAMYGRFQLDQRFDSDQVPLSFVNGLTWTWTPGGEGCVAFMQPSAGLEKRQLRFNLQMDPVGRSCGVPSFLEAAVSGSRRWREQHMTIE